MLKKLFFQQLSNNYKNIFNILLFESSLLEERCNKSLLTFNYKIIILNYIQTKFL